MCEKCQPYIYRQCTKCKQKFKLTCGNFQKNGKYFRHDCNLCRNKQNDLYRRDPKNGDILKRATLSKQERIEKMRSEEPEKYKKLLDRANELNKLKPPSKRVWENLKSRARKANIEFTIKIEDIEVPEYCPVFPWIKLNLNNNVVSDDSPSGDRINNNLPYQKGNVIVVSNRANRLKQDSNQRERERLVEFYQTLTNV